MRLLRFYLSWMSNFSFYSKKFQKPLFLKYDFTKSDIHINGINLRKDHSSTNKHHDKNCNLIAYL